TSSKRSLYSIATSDGRSLPLESCSNRIPRHRCYKSLKSSRAFSCFFSRYLSPSSSTKDDKHLSRGYSSLNCLTISWGLDWNISLYIFFTPFFTESRIFLTCSCLALSAPFLHLAKFANSSVEKASYIFSQLPSQALINSSINSMSDLKVAT